MVVVVVAAVRLGVVVGVSVGVLVVLSSSLRKLRSSSSIFCC